MGKTVSRQLSVVIGGNIVLCASDLPRTLARAEAQGLSESWRPVSRVKQVPVYILYIGNINPTPRSSVFKKIYLLISRCRSRTVEGNQYYGNHFFGDYPRSRVQSLDHEKVGMFSTLTVIQN